jgi:RNA-directed DNA polymerase
MIDYRFLLLENNMTKNWNEINWKQCYEYLTELQYNILIAYREKDKNQVKIQQHRLTRSFAARAIAVRKVVSNKGKKTPGIDKVIWDRKELRFEAIGKLKDLSQYKASPVRRVYIPKAGNKLRPLGIPTMIDRAVQTLLMFTIDPIAEETACQRSYGYRLHRGVKDCAVYLWMVSASPTANRRSILEADIKGFFPSVCHKWLLENIPMDKRILKEFLKAGYMEDASLQPTLEGFPQGSPISPPLANLTLNGLEKILRERDFLTTRYADDFVVLGKSDNELSEVARPLIVEFLSERGLELHPEKTGICSVEEGYDFLGYHFREYPDKGRMKGNKLGAFLVTPSSEKVKAFCKELRILIKGYNEKSLYELTRKLNMKLRGWAEHYRTVTSQKAFNTVSYHVWNALWRKLVRRHRKRSKDWLYKKYFKRKKGNKWIFVTGKGSEKELVLFQISYVEIKRH